MPSIRTVTVTLRAILVSVLVLYALSAGIQPAAANHTDSWGVTQGDQCYTVTPLGDGSDTVSVFYDYRAFFYYEYSSYGTTDIQQSQVSQVMLYNGSDGVSMVILHDKLNDGENAGGVATFDITGLPADGEWAVEDDTYSERDDNFTHGETSSTIDWFWGPNRTDGGAFVGLADHDYDSITIDPGFNEDADYWDSSWTWSTNRTDAWLLRTASGETTELDMNQEISIVRGGCPGAPPSATLTAPSQATVGTKVTLDASESSDDGGILSYRWDTDGDGHIEASTENDTYTRAYQTAGPIEPTVTVVDSGDNTDSASVTVNITDATAPTATISVPSEATTGTDISMTAENSTDNGEIASYEWAFGDNETATGESITHSYEANGTYTVSMTVTDTAGNTATAQAEVAVQEPDTTAPIARLSAPATVDIGTDVTLDASASSDNREIARFEWDGGEDTDISTTNQTATVAYEELGTVEPSVTVVDEAGNTNTTSVTVNVTDTDDPTARLSVPAEGITDTDIAMSAANSTDNGEIASYAWEFGDNETATGESVTHSYETNGTYTVSLTVTDTAGNNATAQTQITVRGPDTTAPTALLSVPSTVEVGTAVTLDASASSDNREIARFEWDVDGDGTAENTTASDTSTFDWTYEARGTVEPAVTVVDEAGNSNTTSATVNVTDTTPPNVTLNASSESVIVGDSIAFDANGSTDNDEIASYEWAFGDNTTAPGESVAHSYETNGSYTVSLTVTDTAGNNATAQTQITVLTPDSTSPDAAVSVPSEGIAGESVSMSGAESTDNRGIASYEWTFGDGANATGEAVGHTYESNGTYSVSLTVTDAAGNSDTATAEIAVLPPDTTPPAASISTDGTTVDVGQDVSFDGSGSTDNREISSYEWTFDDGSTSSATQPTHSYDSAGSYDVQLRVTDAAGNTDTASVSVTVEEDDSGGGAGGGGVGSGGGGGAPVGPPVRTDPPADDGPDEEPARPPMSTTIASVQDTSALVETTNARAGEGATAGFTTTGPAAGAVRLEQVTYRIRSNQPQLTVPFTLSESRIEGQGTDWEQPHNVVLLGYGDEVSLQQIRDVELRFSVRNADDSPRELAFLRRTDGEWREFQPQSLGTSSGRTVYSASAEGGGPIAVDVQRPSIQLGSLSVSPDNLTTVDEARLEATVTNDGELAGTRTLTFTVDGEQVESRSVSVPAGEETTTTFTHGFDTTGTHSLGVNDSQRTVSVRQARAAVSLTELTAEPGTIEEGETATITAVVTNDGEIQGTYTANLTLFGERIGSKSVTVDAGESRTIAFSQPIDSAGEYTAGVGDESVTITVRGTDETPQRPDSAGVNAPGFGVIVAVLAVVILGLVLAARRSE